VITNKSESAAPAVIVLPETVDKAALGAAQVVQQVGLVASQAKHPAGAVVPAAVVKVNAAYPGTQVNPVCNVVPKVAPPEHVAIYAPPITVEVPSPALIVLHKAQASALTNPAAAD